MWPYKTVFYQIYPIGLTGAPRKNDGIPAGRLRKIADWIPHLKKLGIGCVLFNPLFESVSHGYDQTDMRRVDTRLGTNEDLKALTAAFHEAGIRVMFDAVFNHVGRDFFAFSDVREKKWNSPYAGWFNISFDGNSAYNDGFWYEGWEGHYELVKLNLKNPDVKRYLCDSAKYWIDEFGVDGLRLDVAYLLDHDFIRQLKRETKEAKADFFLMGETLFGDYNLLMKDGMLDSVTNYECYKGIYSAINSANFFEIAHSLHRQFGSDPWCLYRGRHLLSFVDNHDVSRIIDRLDDENNLAIAFGLIFAMPGIPCIYYGSEWGMRGRKEDGDDALRPAVKAPEWNEITDLIADLARIRRENSALSFGGYRNVDIKNRQLSFLREDGNERVFAFFNLEDMPFTFGGSYLNGTFTDLIENETITPGGSLAVPGHGIRFLRQEV